MANAAEKAPAVATPVESESPSAAGSVTAAQQRARRKWLWRGIALGVTAIIAAVIIAVVVVVVRRQQREQQAAANGFDASIHPASNGDNVTVSRIGDLHALSKYANITLMETVHDDTIYGSSSNSNSNNNDKKLYVIGDVHGSIEEFNTLVSKLQYDYDAGDRIVLAGDLVMRGPDSVGVIRRAKELKALCVRGNHDDKVVRMKTYLRSGQPVFKTGIIPEGPVMDPLEFNNYHMDVAQNMTDADYEYLANCPMILAIPSLQALFVHAGVNPYRSLDNQQPFTVMNVRTIEDDGSPTKKKGGEEWSDIWNMLQENNNSTFPPEYRKIYYGHAAGNGLQLKSYTFGVDSGCVYGRQLTALEIKTGQLIQVPCKEHYKN